MKILKDILIPKELMSHNRYRHLDNDSKLLYSLILTNFFETSIKNNMTIPYDNYEKVYVEVSSKFLFNSLNLSKSTFNKKLHQLAHNNLIEIGVLNDTLLKAYIVILGNEMFC